MPAKKARKRPNKKPPVKRGSKVLKFPMKFGGILLADFRTVFAKLKEVDARLEIVRRDTFAEQQLPKYKPLMELLKKRNETEQERVERGQDVQKVVQKIADRFNIPIEEMHHYAINDETGVVTYAPSKSVEVKKSPTKKTKKKGLKNG
jgi:hypothetical protein